MIVPDTSAWVEYLRDSDHPVGRALDHLIQRGQELAVTEVVLTELLAGARSRQAFHDLRSRLLAFPMLTLDTIADFEDAALVYRACRAGGETLRSITDCLIAVPAMRAGAQILHKDGDFDVIARHTPLKIYRPR